MNLARRRVRCNRAAARRPPAADPGSSETCPSPRQQGRRPHAGPKDGYGRRRRLAGCRSHSDWSASRRRRTHIRCRDAVPLATPEPAALSFRERAATACAVSASSAAPEARPPRMWHRPLRGETALPPLEAVALLQHVHSLASPSEPSRRGWNLPAAGVALRTLSDLERPVGPVAPPVLQSRAADLPEPSEI